VTLKFPLRWPKKPYCAVRCRNEESSMWVSSRYASFVHGHARTAVAALLPHDGPQDSPATPPDVREAVLRFADAVSQARHAAPAPAAVATTDLPGVSRVPRITPVSAGNDVSARVAAFLFHLAHLLENGGAPVGASVGTRIDTTA
jgi:hypothetical protein